jgi:hypothetical protein
LIQLRISFNQFEARSRKAIFPILYKIYVSQ